MKLAAARALTKPLTQALGAAFATAKAHILSTARSSRRIDSSEQAEKIQQAWLQTFYVEFISVVERTIAVGRDGSATVEVNDIFDRTRVYIADKLSF